MTTSLNVQSFDLTGKGSRELIYYRVFRFNHSETEFKKITLFLFYGFGEHAGRFDQFVTRLIEEFLQFHLDLTVVVPDYYGHGKSSGARGHIESFESIVDDLMSVMNRVKEQHDSENTDYYIMGKGIGALYALEMAHTPARQLSYGLKGLILLNPAFKMKWSLPKSFEKINLGKVGSLGKLRLPFRFEDSVLAHISHNAVPFDEDPLVSHYLTFSTFSELLKASARLRTCSYFIDASTLMMLTDEEFGLFDHEISELFSRGLADSSVKKYKTQFEDSESNDMTEQMIKDIVNWYKSITIK